MTDSVEATQESAERALQILLRAIVGPNYSGALKQGDVAQQIELCLTWVKAEASEAASLIESCVPQASRCWLRRRPGWRACSPCSC